MTDALAALRRLMHAVARTSWGWLVTLGLAVVAYFAILLARYLPDQVAQWVVLFLFAATVFLFEPTYRSLWAGEAPAFGTSTRRAVGQAFLWTAALWVLAVSVFASTSFVAWRADLFHVSPRPSTSGIRGSFDFVSLYVWHLCDTLPGVKATDTLAWNPPLKYEGEALGSAVLVYKVAVLLPLIAAFRGVWRTREQRSAVSTEPA